jgi:surface protein
MIRRLRSTTAGRTVLLLAAVALMVFAGFAGVPFVRGAFSSAVSNLGNSAGAASSFTPMTVTVDTTLPGANPRQITLPLRGNVNVGIDWGGATDNCPTSLVSANQTTDTACTYTADGQYTIKLYGTITQFGTGNANTYTPANAPRLTGVTNWGNTGLTSLAGAFSGATNLTTVPADLPATVTSLRFTFFGATSFNHPNIAGWNTTNVVSMDSVFYSATAFNQPIGTWNTASATSTSQMFRFAAAFNQPIGTWNTANVVDMAYMFASATAFNQDISAWNTAKVTSMNTMFTATNFNQPIGTWNTANVVDMGNLFLNAAAFNQDISAWNTAKVTNMTSAFRNAAAFNRNLSGWCVPLIASAPSTFDTGATSWAATNWRPQWGTCPTAPAQTTALTATAGDGQVAVSWTAPSNGGAVITGYDVRWATNAAMTGATTVTNATTGSVAGNTYNAAGTAYTLTGLTNGTSIYVQVRATNAKGSATAWGPTTPVVATPYPTSLMTLADVAFWLDAADPSTMFTDTAGTTRVTSTSDTVARWNDKSYLANTASQATAGSRPALTAVGDRLVPTFNGNSSGLSMDATKLPTGTSASTTFVVAQPTATSGLRATLNWGANASGQIRWLGVDNGQMYTSAYGTANPYNGTWASGTTRLAVTQFASAAGTLWNTGNAPVTVTGSFTTGTSAAAVGNGAFSSQYWQGPIHEVIVINRVLTDAERRTIETYLATKWGLTLAPAAPLSAGADRNVVTTFAGSGNSGSTDATGTSASFYQPMGVAFDAAGNLAVADYFNGRIRTVTPGGIVSTFAFTNRPTGLAYDTAGNLYVAAGGDDVIRRITPGGVISSFAGFGNSGFVDGTGTTAYFNSPSALAFDTAGNLFVADTGNHAIRRITSAGVVTTLAGNGTPGSTDGTGSAARFNAPAGIAIDAAGNLYVADTGNHTIRRIDTATGAVTTVAGSGTAGSANGTGTAATFNAPRGLATDPIGNLYITEQSGNRVRRMAADLTVTTVAGTGVTGTADGPATAARFTKPSSIAIDAGGSLYVTDIDGHTVRKVVPAGSGSLAVTWTSSTDTGGAAITGHTATATASGQTTRTCTGVAPSTSCTITGLTDGVSYTVTVAATNSAGTGVATAAGSATPLGAPGAATNAIASAANGRVDVSWDPPASTGGNPIGLYVATLSPGGAQCRLTNPSASARPAVGAITTRTETDNGAWNTRGHGAYGYVLAGYDGSYNDRAVLPPGISYTNNAVVGTVGWPSSTTDTRALQDPARTTRAAQLWFSTTSMTQAFTFAEAANRTMRLYALDWSSTARRQTVSVTVSGVTQTATLSSSFNAGIWLDVPISVPAGGTVTITTTLTAGTNAVLSGVFFDAPTTNTCSFTGLTAGTPYAATLVAYNGSLTNGATGTTSGGWSPASVSPSVWFDANDAATLTVSSNLVSAWADKSGNARTLTQAVTATRPAYATASQNGRPGVNFSSDKGLSASGLTSFTNAFTIAVVKSPTATWGGYHAILDKGATGTRIGGLTERNNTGMHTNAAPAAAWQNGTNVTVSTSNFTTITNANLLAFTPSTTAMTSLAMGNYDANTTGGAATQYETIALGMAPSITDRQTIEGYLAWKWGTQTSLAAGHPYLNAAPGPAPVTTPGAPTITGATAGSSQVTVTWTPPANTGGSPINRYYVRAYTDAAGTTQVGEPQWTSTPGTTSLTFTGLTPQTTYWFRVTAVTTAGAGTASAVSTSATPYTTPGAPTAVTATAAGAVSWTAPASNGGSAITGYTATATASGQTTRTCTTTGATTCTLVGLANTVTYSVTVTATNVAGTGPASTAVSVTPNGFVAAATGFLTSSFGQSGTFADLNGDTFPDLISTGTLAWAANNGTGTFTNMGAGGLSSGNSQATAMGDYDGDGDLDVFLSGCCATPNDKLFRNNGSGTFTDVSTAAGIKTTDHVGRRAAWADYDNDGDLDLIAGGDSGTNANWLYRNNGDSTFTDVTAAAGLTGTGGEVIWFDIDSDGDPDLLAAGTVWRNNGNGTFTSAQTGFGTGAAVAGDYDNDGDLDLLAGSALWANNGSGTFTNTTTAAGLTGLTSAAAATFADIDNDGDLDLYLAYNGANALWRNNGNGTFTNATTATGLGDPGNSLDSSWADIDRDGDLDLYVTNYTTPSVLYRNDATAPAATTVHRVNLRRGTVQLPAGVTIDLLAGATRVATRTLDENHGKAAGVTPVLFANLTPATSYTIRWRCADGTTRTTDIGTPDNTLRTVDIRCAPDAPTGLAASNLSLSVFAGSGTAGSTDANGTAASFAGPRGAAFDTAGNLYVADFGNNKIRKVDTNGNVSTFAGSGTAGSADANGTAASFNGPQGLAFDSAGNLYVADLSNHKIRRITPAGDVTTFAGSGTAGSADANGTAASFNGPIALAFDSAGNLYVADYYGQLVRRITPSGVVSTFAGSGSGGSADANGTAASFNGPRSLAFDASGNLYVADLNNHKIRRINPAGDVTTFAGSGTAGSADANGTAASFNGPRDLAIDTAGNLYVADLNNHEIRRITPAAVVTTIAGSGTAGTRTGSASGSVFAGPNGLARDATGTLHITEQAGNRVTRISPAGSGSLAVSWTAPTSTGDSAITGYRIEYRTSPSGTWTLFGTTGAAVTSTTVTGLTDGITYDIRISATNAAGTGTASTTVTATPGTAPGAPTALALSPSTGQLLASWTAPATTGGSAITDYVVEVRTSPSGTWTVFADGVSPATITTIGGLTDGATYDVRVRAVNTFGISSASTAATSTVLPSGLALWLDAADASTLTTSGGQVSQWNDKSGNARNVTQATTSLQPSATTQTMNGRPVITFNGTTVLQDSSGISNRYGITGDRTMIVVGRVRVAGAGGTLIDRSPATTNLFGLTSESGPRLQVRDDANGQFQNLGTVSRPAGTTLVLTATRSGSALTYYVSSALSASSTLTGTVTQPPISVGRHATAISTADQDVAEVLLFNRALTATEQANVEAYLASKWGAVLAPGAPTAVSATAGSTQATVSWTAPASNGGSAITGYTATATASGQTTRTCTTTGATSCTVTGLVDGITYSVTVAATNTAGTGASSSAVSVTPYPVSVMSGSSFALWLDAADASTITQSAGAVSQWNDKSGNNRNVAQASGSARPTFGSTAWNGTGPALSFDGATTYLDGGDTLDLGTSGLTVLSVAKPSVAGASGTIIAKSRYAGGTGRWGLLSLTGGTCGTPAAAGMLYSTATSANAFAATPDTATAKIYGGAIDRTGGMVTAFANGGRTAATSYTPDAATNHDTTDLLLIGAYPNNTGTVPPQSGCFFNGTIAEIVVLRAAISNADRRLVEEYLARKWGLTITPGLPTGVSATAGAAQATVSWSTPSWDGGSAITGYTATATAAGQTTQTCTTAGATTCTITGLTGGVSYSVTVTATNTVGTGSPSAATTVTPTAASVPGAPTSVGAQPADASADIAWNAPASDGGTPITSYTATATAAGQPTRTCTTTGNTWCTINGLTNGVQYTVTVTATNAAGTGPASNPVYVTPYQGPQ